MTDVTPVARTRPIQHGSERTTLESMLDFYRATVVNKVAGLTDNQAFTAAVSPSTLTPGTVVRHLTGTERFWFSIDFADLDVTWPWTDDDLHGNFRVEPATRSPRSWPTTSRSARDLAARSQIPTSTMPPAERHGLHCATR